MTIEKDKTIAQIIHDGRSAEQRVEYVIDGAFGEFEPNTYHIIFEYYRIGFDDYDNSIEIYFNASLPYPYEPCKEIRDRIYELGFDMVYWNFEKDTFEGEKDEIRGWEPRHVKNASEWTLTKYGYVDSRFNESEWLSKYHRDK